MKWSLLSGRFWIAFATIAVVGLLFAYYFLSYIPVREDQLLSKKYRALERIARNFSEMHANYVNSVDLLLGQHDPEAMKNWIEEMSRLQRNDTVKNAAKVLETIRNEFDRKRKEMKNELDRNKVELITPTRLGRSRQYREGEYIYIKRFFRVKVSDLITNEDIVDNNFDRLLVIRMFRGMANLRKGQEQRDSVIVAYQGKKFEEANGAESKILLNDISFLFDTAQVFRTIPMHKIRIAGKPYRVLSYIVEIAGQDWVMCGLVSEASTRADIRKVDLFPLILLVLVALFLLLSMPVLKLLIMSSIERLQILNVWFIGFSIVTGAALVTILLLVGHHYLNYKDDYRAKLRQLSQMVTTNFQSEINSIVLQMASAKRAFPEGPLRSQYDYALTNSSGVRMKADSLTYKYFNELLFLNNAGKVPLVFANHMLAKASSELPDLSRRKYFSEPNAGNLLSFISDTAKFYIQSIRSWNSGRHEAGVSVKTDLKVSMPLGGNVDTEIDDHVKFAVIATATRLRSVMNPLLPPGYQFCIVDANGETQFHSDIKKNLQENFLDEIDHDNLAEAIVAAKASRNVEVNYSGKTCLAYIAPLTQSMFLVTLLDQEYYNIPIVLTVGGVWVLTATMLLFLGVQLVLLFCFTYRSSKLQIRRFSLGWVGPRSDTGKIPFKMGYARCLTAMLIIALGLTLIYFWGFARYLSVAFLTLPLLLLAAHYSVLYEADPENNSLSHRNYFVLTSVLLVTAATILALVQGNHLHVRLVLLQLSIMLVITLNLRTQLFAAVHEWFGQLSLLKLYSMFLLCWLFLVGVLPVFYFYKTAFVHENFLWKKFIQWEAYQSKKARTALLKREFAETGYFENSDNHQPEYLSQSEYLCVSDHFGDYRLCDIDSFDVKTAHEIDDNLLDGEEFEFRPAFVGPLEKSRSALIASPQVFKWFVRSSRDGLFLEDDGEVMYSSVIPPFALMKGKYAPAFVLTFLLFLYALFVLIRTCVRYIFGIGLLQPNARMNLHELVEESLRERGHKMFIIGLPYSGKSELLRNIGSKHIVKEIFLRTDLDSQMDFSSYDLFIVHNFEHALNDQLMNEKRLQLFINLQRNHKANILVTSTVQPDSILDVLEGRIKQMIQDKKTEEKDKAALQKEINSMRNSHRIWKNILSGFEIQFQPLSATDRPATLLARELEIGNFLPRLKKYFKDIRDIDEEEIVLQIEARASAYYQSLWNSFTRKEKHALFDLAKDRFLNLRDAAKVRMLMNKGIIVMRDSPQIMNRSFNNFILSVVKEDEALAMTNELRRKGSWAGLQLVLVIMLVSVVIFIAFVQQEILTSINALVLTISSVVALLARFSGIFGGSKPKE